MSQCAIYFYRLDYPLRENQRNLSDEDMRLLRAAIRKAGFGGSREERIVNMVMQETAEGEGDFSAYGHRYVWEIVHPGLV